jgi:hypothetical protein
MPPGEDGLPSGVVIEAAEPAAPLALVGELTGDCIAAGGVTAPLAAAGAADVGGVTGRTGEPLLGFAAAIGSWLEHATTPSANPSRATHVKLSRKHMIFLRMPGLHTPEQSVQQPRIRPMRSRFHA